MKQLPTEGDFDPWGGNLDAQSAWRNFGGLSLDEATARFQENPSVYQEDFMFMGGRAFAFYFPVIENHFQAVPASELSPETWILAHCIRQHFDENDSSDVQPLAPRVLDLAHHVLAKIARIETDDSERQRLAEPWTALVQQIRSITRR